MKCICSQHQGEPKDNNSFSEASPALFHSLAPALSIITTLLSSITVYLRMHLCFVQGIIHIHINQNSPIILLIHGKLIKIRY